MLGFSLPQDHTYGKVTCIAHKLEWKVPVGGNQGWSFSQFFLECLKGFNTLIGEEEERGIFLKKTGHRPGYLRKVLNESLIETGMTKKAMDTLDGSGMRFGTPRAIISDRGMHFCNDQFAKVMLKCGVTHRLATAYHPQTSGHVEVSNRGLKRILERKVGENHSSWSDKLDDAL
nr:reverse transcriptase domain-containing protein [Tanacetum cinerariifolium]